jgi:peptidoglycan hydrolase-like protein with peptidoglycan-binding domain
MANLRKGTKGKSVKELQIKLNKAGAKPPLKDDGDFGPTILLLQLLLVRNFRK